MAVSRETLTVLEKGIAAGKILPQGLRTQVLTGIAMHLAEQPEDEETLVRRSLLLKYADLVERSMGVDEREVLDRLSGLIRIKLRGV